MMTLQTKILIYFTAILFFPFTELFQFEKRWTKTNSWEDPSNWSPPRLPCPKDNIVLTDDVVYIEHNVTFETDLILPSDGEIVFGLNTNIVFGETTNKRKRRDISECSGGGGKVSFVGQHEKEWFNPNNWEIYKDGKKDEYMSKAVPYIERVPCLHDRVSFPKGDAFKIDIEDEITVKEVVINGDVIKHDTELKSYVSTKEGKTRFNFQPPAGSLNLDPTPCGKPVCECGNQVWREKICKTFTCPTKCKKVKPRNDCCYHCGALVDFTYDGNFDLRNCSNDLRALLSRENKYKYVRLYMSDIQGRVQILASEDNDGAAAESAADSIQRYINENPPEACGGGGRNVTKPRARVKKGASTGDEEGTSGGSLALAIIIPVLLLVIIIVGGAYIKRKRYPKITKRRFENENDFSKYPGIDDIEMTTDFTVPEVHSGDIAFENPTYNVSEDQSGGKEMESADSASPQYAEIAENIYTRIIEEANEGIKEGEEAGYVEVRLPEDVSGVVNPMFDVHYRSRCPPSSSHTDDLNAIPGKMTTEVSEVELESADVVDVIKGKLELNLKDPSDSEDVGDVLYEEVGSGKPPDNDLKKWVTDFDSLDFAADVEM